MRRYERKRFSSLVIFASLITIVAGLGLAQKTQVPSQQVPSQQVTKQSASSVIERSVYDIIERVAGKRDFSATVVLTFDVLDGNSRKVTTLKFDMRSENLEVFTFTFASPEILRGITITYDLVGRKISYRYGNVVLTQPQVPPAVQVSSIVQSITDFLSSPVFEVKEEKNEVIFTPKNAQILARFGVQPIRVTLQLDKGLPRLIKITNGKNDEKIMLEFENFKIG